MKEQRTLNILITWPTDEKNCPLRNNAWGASPLPAPDVHNKAPDFQLCCNEIWGCLTENRGFCIEEGCESCGRQPLKWSPWLLPPGLHTCVHSCLCHTKLGLGDQVNKEVAEHRVWFQVTKEYCFHRGLSLPRITCYGGNQLPVPEDTQLPLVRNWSSGQHSARHWGCKLNPWWLQHYEKS